MKGCEYIDLFSIINQKSESKNTGKEELHLTRTGDKPNAHLYEPYTNRKINVKKNDDRNSYKTFCGNPEMAKERRVK